MKLSNVHKFILVVGGQALLIVGIVLLRFFMFGDTTDVLLKINPVDPRDPLRGDYVTFTYEIGEVGGYNINYSDVAGMNVGDTVYVLLNEYPQYINYPEDVVYNDLMQVSRYLVGYVNTVQLEKPGPEELFIQGTIVDFDGVREDEFTNDLITIEYGIEEYFIPEGTGQNLWSENLDNVYAHVKINKDGRAQLEQIYKDGKKWPAVNDKK